MQMGRWVILFWIISSHAFCQSLLVEGIVVDADTGKPVPFASVGVTGTSKGTSTNLDGKFSISVDEPVSLSVTCIGYQSLRISAASEARLIQLKSVATQLDPILISDKPIDVRKIIANAFSRVKYNYATESFLQTYFYRHYCKDDDRYGRLIEASIDVWRPNGYKSTRQTAKEKEQIRVTQLRRSMDMTAMAYSHEPISITSVLETDLVGFQSESDQVSFHDNVSTLKKQLGRYAVTFKGLTFYDEEEVYEIGFKRRDSVPMTSGQFHLRTLEGSVFITTDTYAFVKTEITRTVDKQSTHASTYYRRYADKYYPYHFILEGTQNDSAARHAFHIELMSVEIKYGKDHEFRGGVPGRRELLDISYDSGFWTASTILMTTPVEDEIIRDLGGGTSLNKQFHRFRNYELNTRDGGIDGERKFGWLKDDSKGHRNLYLVFWNADFKNHLLELELAKRLQKEFRDKISVVFISLDDDQKRWEETIARFNFQSDGIINYRIGSKSPVSASFNVDGIPKFVLISQNGETIGSMGPGDFGLKEEIRDLEGLR